MNLISLSYCIENYIKYEYILIISLFQIFAKHTKSITKKFARHFKKIYNLLDFIVVILFLFGFTIKARLSATNTERYDLTKFS